jgi:hypothetical protein
MTDAVTASRFDRARLALLADWLAVCVAVSLPWSTSATAIAIVIWLVVLLPSLDIAAGRRALESAPGALPVVLWCLAAIGMLWADVNWPERIEGLGGFHRLLVIPLLLAQFRRSDHGAWVLYGFLCSATALLLTSWALALIPGLEVYGKGPGVLVKDYIFQSAEFLACAFALIAAACAYGRRRNIRMALALLGMAALFLADIAFVSTSRTVLLVTPVLAVLLGWRQLGWKGMLNACILGAVVTTILWFSSPYLRERIGNSFVELQAYRATDAVNSTGLHFEFLIKSWTIISAAPVFGHGTGSITDQFRRAAVGDSGTAAVVSVNPHNQIFAVAIQLGMLGAAVLVAMWAAHVWLFRGGGLTGWIGTVIVVENIVSSLFNSHLFDFSHGWLYVFGVGVAGGMVLGKEGRASTAGPAALR